VNSSAAARSLLVMMHRLNALDVKMQLFVCGAQRNVFLSYVMSFKLGRSADLCSTSSNTVVTNAMRHNVSLTVHHELTIQNYQRDALNIIYSSNIITLLYMFRASSTHLQEDIVVHKQHMVPSLSIRVLVSC